jgi:hypothetical protein
MAMLRPPDTGRSQMNRAPFTAFDFVILLTISRGIRLGKTLKTGGLQSGSPVSALHDAKRIFHPCREFALRHIDERLTLMIRESLVRLSERSGLLIFGFDVYINSDKE